MTKKKSKKSLPDMIRSSATVSEAREAAKDPNLFLNEATKLKAPLCIDELNEDKSNALGRGKSAMLREMAKKEGWEVKKLELPDPTAKIQRAIIQLETMVRTMTVVLLEAQSELFSLRCALNADFSGVPLSAIVDHEKKHSELLQETLRQGVMIEDLAVNPIFQKTKKTKRRK